MLGHGGRRCAAERRKAGRVPPTRGRSRRRHSGRASWRSTPCWPVARQGGAHPPAPEIVTISTAGAPSLGSKNAPLVLVELTDFQCPYCIKFQNEVFGPLKREYVDTGKLRIVSRNLPLPMHQYADAAARAAALRRGAGEVLAGAGSALRGERRARARSDQGDHPGR